MSNKSQTCVACAFTGRVSGRGNWISVHTECPLAGKEAPRTFTTERCPAHGEDFPLVWALGPFSTYAQCNHPKCAVGKSTKGYNEPFRVFAGGKTNVRSNGVQSHTTVETTETTETTTDTGANDIVIDASTVATVAPGASTLNLKNLGTLGDTILAAIDERARAIAAELTADAMSKVGAAAPRVIEWRTGDSLVAKLEGTHHHVVPSIIRAIKQEGFYNVWMAGPAGSGKSTIGKSVADSFGLPFAFISGSAGVTESQLTGWGIQNLQTGEMVYVSTDFVEIFENGGVFLVDECDGFDGNVLLTLQAALANGHMSLPYRRSTPIAKRHPHCYIIVAANTWGLGADAVYCGRAPLDGAFLDRFVGARFRVDYDRDLESNIARTILEKPEHVLARVWKIRDTVLSLKWRRIVGTRFVMSACRIVAAGGTVDQALARCCEGWTTDELSKAGVTAVTS